MKGLQITDRIVSWFIPASETRGRTETGLARTFVFTHLFGPLIAQPMSFYLYYVSPSVDFPLVVMALAICSFWTLPFVLRWTGSVKIVAFASFQLLASASLFGAYHYGGFSSPFLPWLVVSMLLGLFYLSKHPRIVLSLFALNLAVFLVLISWKGTHNHIPIDDLRVIGWLSIASATVYMTWMALYYSRIIGLRSELEIEIERQRTTSVDLEKARGAAEVNAQSRARFFAKMSHELRTPLNAIIGYSDILLEDCQIDGSGDEQRARDITRINSAGRHLLSLVADVLDASKIENDVVSLEPTRFTLGELCDDVVASAQPMVEKNGNSFVVSCPQRGYVLHTDAKKLRQVLLNLLSNAGKFTQNGSVRLKLAIEQRPGDDHLHGVVTDTGIGIDAEALPRLFTDYEQADATVFNRFGGTGIGLALSRKLAILLGGDIEVTSRIGQGSTFGIAVPTQVQSERARTEPASGDGADVDAASPIPGVAA